MIYSTIEQVEGFDHGDQDMRNSTVADQDAINFELSSNETRESKKIESIFTLILIILILFCKFKFWILNKHLK